MDLYGGTPITYNTDAKFDKPDIYVWVRTYKRVMDNFPGTLTINNVTLPFADTNEANLNQWIWERVGPFPNTGSEISIAIDRPEGKDQNRFMSLFIDSIVVTDDPSLTPEAELKERVPVQKYPVTEGAASGTIKAGLPPGQYSCRLELYSNQNLVDSFGRQPVVSNSVEFRMP